MAAAATATATAVAAVVAVAVAAAVAAAVAVAAVVAVAAAVAAEKVSCHRAADALQIAMIRPRRVVRHDSMVALKTRIAFSFHD